MSSSSSSSVPRRLGAYGLHLNGLTTAATHYLAEAPGDWTDVAVERATGITWDGPDTLTDERAEYSITGTKASVRIDRNPLSVRFCASAGMDDHTIIHPGLAGVASIASRWLDRDAFHAGGFLDSSGRVWAVLGAKGAGKSSALGYLAVKGFDVIADDVLVIANGSVFAGPRFVDLREEAADWLGQGVDIGIVGLRRRWRVALPNVQAEAPLAGWVVPEWDDQVKIDVVPATERLALLCMHLGLHLPPRDPVRMLELASRPFLSFRRPRRWDRMDEAMATLMNDVEVR